MKVDYHKRFLKQVAKAPHQIQMAVRERIAIFRVDRLHHLLYDHALHGEWVGFRSINITGDWRAIYRDHGEGTIEWIEFVELGTHHKLYG